MKFEAGGGGGARKPVLPKREQKEMSISALTTHGTRLYLADREAFTASVRGICRRVPRFCACGRLPPS